MITNLTPHSIAVHSADGLTLIRSLPTSGTIARVSAIRTQTGELDGLPIFSTHYGEVIGLPAEQADTTYVVSGLVRAAVPHRRDVLSPGELIRNPAGQPIGCRGLDANA